MSAQQPAPVQAAPTGLRAIPSGRRHRLAPYYRPLRRGDGSVQLGASAESGGFVLAGVASADLAVLEMLAGSSWVGERDLVAAYAAVAPAGAHPDQDVAGLLLLLASNGAVISQDAPAHPGRHTVRAMGGEPLVDDLDALGLVGADPVARMVARTHCTVLVSGAGRLPEAVARLLRSTGVGRVWSGTLAADHAESQVRWGLESGPDVVVLGGDRAIDPAEGDWWRGRGVPVLPTLTDGSRVVVGPLVTGDPVCPCLRCVEMARATLDPARPTVLAHAVSHTRDAPGSGRGSREGTESTLVATAAGLAAMMVHATLAGDPVPVGVALEVALPWPAPVQRRWRRHPGCRGHEDTGAAVGDGPG